MTLLLLLVALCLTFLPLGAVTRRNTVVVVYLKSASAYILPLTLCFLFLVPLASGKAPWI